jgi:hypothetical protein
MTMDSIEKLEKQLATKWLKSLSRKDRAEARKGIAAGRKWGESGRSYNAVKAVAEFAVVVFSKVRDEFWDSAFDHYDMAMEEAVGDDDADFDAAMNEGWGPFYQGWLVGVGVAFAEMVETGGSRCLACGGVMS